MLKSTEYHGLPGTETEDRAGFCPLGSTLKVLLVWPRFPSSFWTFDGVLDLVRIETNHPPLGLLTVAALCPKNWTLRLIDRSFEKLLDTDLLWADLVMVSGMRVQIDDIREILRRARALGKRTMIGGPFASSEPELLLQLADHVVVGEPDEVFPEIASDLERGSARRLYEAKKNLTSVRRRSRALIFSNSRSMPPWPFSSPAAAHSSASSATSSPSTAESPEPRPLPR